MPDKKIGSCLDPELPGTGLRAGGDKCRARHARFERKESVEPIRDGGDMRKDREEPIRDVTQEDQRPKSEKIAIHHISLYK
jgi:hypothetical protein